MSKARDEKIKLTAAYLNAIASALVTIGVVGPLVAVLLNLGDAQAKVSLWALLLSCLLFAAISYGIHRAARKILNGLEP